MQPLIQILSSFNCCFELLSAVAVEQFLPGGLRVHSQAANARDNSRPIF